jgi:hypothetical protein
MWMRKSGNLHHYAVPFAMVSLAGLVHAAFEDWLFAPGSYICLFFWVLAFLLIDLTSEMNTDLRISNSRSVSGLAPARGFLQPTG